MQNPPKKKKNPSLKLWLENQPKAHSTPLLNCCIESHYCVDKPKFSFLELFWIGDFTPDKLEMTYKPIHWVWHRISLAMQMAENSVNCYSISEKKNILSQRVSLTFFFSCWKFWQTYSTWISPVCDTTKPKILSGSQPGASFARHMKIQTSCLYSSCGGLVAETFQ